MSYPLLFSSSSYSEIVSYFHTVGCARVIIAFY